MRDVWLYLYLYLYLLLLPLDGIVVADGLISFKAAKVQCVVTVQSCICIVIDLANPRVCVWIQCLFLGIKHYTHTHTHTQTYDSSTRTIMFLTCR